MNIFKKRPLSLILCIMLGGFSLFLGSAPITRVIFICAAALVLGVTFAFKTLFRGRNALVRVACAAFAISILCSQLFLLLFIPRSHIGKSVEFVGTVDSVDIKPYSINITLKTDKIDGKRDAHKLLISGDKATLSGIIEGDVISVVGVAEEFGKDNSDFDTGSYYFSRGYSATIEDIEAVTVLEHNVEFKKNIFRLMRSRISARLMLETDSLTGGFLAALIVGDKTHLDDNTNINYSLIGISHILALSGMHLVILSETLRHILSRLRLNKKIILICSTLFCLFYMALTGFSASVVRAAVMLTITNGLFLLTGTHDSYTTLPLSVVLIILVQPYSAYDISLWLSAFATLGVLIFGKWDREREDGARGIVAALIWIRQAILITIFALSASYIIMLCFFNLNSLFAPLTTLIFSAPINFLIFAGIAILILYPIIPLGTPVIFITETINIAAEWVASIQWGTYSTSYPIVKIMMVAVAVLFYAFVVLKIKHKRIYISVLCAVFVLGSAAGVYLTQRERSVDEISYYSGEYSDSTLIKWDGEVSLIRNGTTTVQAAHEDISRVGTLYVENLYICSYRSGLSTYVKEFLKSVKLDTLHIPVPKSTEELKLAEGLAELLSTYGAGMNFYETELPVALGPAIFYPLYNTTYKGSATDCIYMLTISGERYSYFSRGITEDNRAHSLRVAKYSDYVFFGNQGAATSQSHEFSFSSDRVKGVYYSKYNPLSEECIEYYQEKEVPIKKIGTSFNFIR